MEAEQDIKDLSIKELCQQLIEAGRAHDAHVSAVLRRFYGPVTAGEALGLADPDNLNLIRQMIFQKPHRHNGLRGKLRGMAKRLRGLRSL